LSVEQLEQFVLTHLSTGRRGPAPTLGLHRIFNYILQLLYMGCQWKALPMEKNDEGRPEIHYTRIYRALRRWQADGCIDRIFAGSVRKLHQEGLLDLTVIHGDGTSTADSISDVSKRGPHVPGPPVEVVKPQPRSAVPLKPLPADSVCREALKGAVPKRDDANRHPGESDHQGWKR
jgi:transposase